MKSTLNGWRVTALCAGALVAALLASCGGGGTQQTFFASRVLAFGDEHSVINTDQSKYTINALLAGSSTALDCNSNPLWIQSVAAIYGLLFPQCPDISGIEPVSRIYATNGAMVADLSTQIDAALNETGINSGDLVTVLVGENDIVAQFNQYPTVGEDTLLANLDAAGVELANQVNRLAGLGARVLISTAPNIGLTPFAGDRSAGSTDSNPALLSRLSVRFNDAMLAHLLNDGHKIGLIQFDEYLQAVDTATLAGSNSGYANTTLPACAVALPKCTTNTLVADAVNAVWLWADNRHVGPTGQAALGSLATTRAQNNPF
jgi:outer membrane lipase/esterase